jgi:hypothetical protein
MRLLAFIAAIAVLFCLNQASAAETGYYSGVAPASYAAPTTPTARAVGLRLLTWPGKVNEAPRSREQATASASAPVVRRAWNPYPAAIQPAPAARAPAQAYVPQTQAALPASIYAAPPPPVAAPPPPPAPMQQARAAPAMTRAASSSDGDYQPPHFYSLYREYGQTPDPIPQSEFDPKTGSSATTLNAQFFAASTPDMAQPPPPVPQTTTTSGGRVIQTVPPSPDDNPG